jgi:Uma2 family endonuclease
MAAMPLEQEIEYPTSDGQPMAETTLHREVMQDTIWTLERRYADVPDVWVGGNLFLCYEEGNPAAVLAPDVLLAKGVSKWKRPNYLLWQEVPPTLIVEVTSRSTRREDLGKKKNLYERIGVGEYVLFDPYGEYLKPRLQGYRLEGGVYQAIPLAYDSLESRTTGVLFRPEGERLRLVNAATGEPLLWSDELERVLRQETAGRERAEASARALEERVRLLEEEMARLRGKLPT